MCEANQSEATEELKDEAGLVCCFGLRHGNNTLILRVVLIAADFK